MYKCKCLGMVFGLRVLGIRMGPLSTRMGPLSSILYNACSLQSPLTRLGNSLPVAFASMLRSGHSCDLLALFCGQEAGHPSQENPPSRPVFVPC